MTKAERSRNLRYKRPALAEIGLEVIYAKLYEIQDACGDVRWFVESNDDTLLNAFDGDEDEEYEFRMAFTMLESESSQLIDTLNDAYGISDYFDDCTVALIGNRFNLIGYDDYEEDYYSLTSYESDLAFTESGKRIMRMTKAEMLATIGQCMGIVLAFQNVQYKYDYLKATFDILRDKNTSILKTIKEIESLYEEAEKEDFYECKEATKKFDRLVSELPDKLWIE